MTTRHSSLLLVGLSSILFISLTLRVIDGFNPIDTSTTLVDLENPTLNPDSANIEEAVPYEVPSPVNVPVAETDISLLVKSPTAEIGGPYTGKSYDPIYFNANVSRAVAGSKIITYQWDWNNDGVYDQNTTQPYAQHIWNRPCNETIALRVIDNNNLMGTDTARLTVVSAQVVYVVICSDTEVDQDHRDLTSRNPIFTVNTYLPSNSVMSHVMDGSLRSICRDSYGGGFKVTWFMEMDGYMAAGVWPTGEAAGSTALYRTMVKYWQPQLTLYGDELAFHHHNMHYTTAWQTRRDGLTDLSNPKYTYYEDVLNALIMDEEVFLSAYRGGWNWENDAVRSWLNQWVPFDYTEGDLYIPSMLSGQRWVIGTQELGSNVSGAFKTAAHGTSIILAQYGHNEWQNFTSQIVTLHQRLIQYSQQYGIKFRYVTATEAMQNYLGQKGYAVDSTGPNISIKKQSNVLYQITSNETLFGNKPYVALKLKNGTYCQASTTSNGANSWLFSIPATSSKISTAFLQKIVPISTSASSWDSYATPQDTANGLETIDNYWAASANIMSQWLQFDFGSPEIFNELKLNFYECDSRTYTYSIQASNNTDSWTTVIPLENGEEVMVDDFSSVNARYLRIVVTGNIGVSNAILEEAEVYNVSSSESLNVLKIGVGASDVWGNTVAVVVNP